jgi:pyruvate, water dikinase
MPATAQVRWFSTLRRDDVPVVGGKNASLGEMQSQLAERGVRVPEGFATTASAYRSFLAHNDLEGRVAAQIDLLHAGTALSVVGAELRRMFSAAALPPDLAGEVTAAYRQLQDTLGRADVAVAVRSSATAEDLPEASFAGQQETYLNVVGEAALLEACQRCFASLFTDRAINYREDHGFDHLDVALSVGVQRMVRSDVGSAGVMFTLDTESGFPRVVMVSAAWGLGETVVSGEVDPDEYVVFKPLLRDPALVPVISRVRGGKQCKAVYDESGTRVVATSPAERLGWVLDDAEILDLARWAVAVEEHYGMPMDLEWAKDGVTGELFIVQARPETVQVRREATHLRTYRLTGTGTRLVTGLAVGDGVATARVCRLQSPQDIDRFEDGAVLVTDVTDPDWEPVMKRAAAIVTDHGGRTSHAAIVSRELGVTAIVGAGTATTALTDGQTVTVSCAEGDVGYVYDGAVPHEERTLDLSRLPATRTRVMLNLANPAAALRWWRLPADGVGLVRMEFVVNNHVRIHPMALVRFDDLDAATRDQVAALTVGYDDRTEYFVERLSHGVARIAASRWPDPVVVRLSDFKTNEYARLVGGARFEPAEENPMLGWRGASRYYSEGYREGFALECRALRRVRDDMGLTNVVVMVPFCRTPDEADRVLAVLGEHGLVRGRNGLEVYVMAEIPANIVLAEEFADRFDGFSIGSNDLTQLMLGVDRDSEALAHLFDERNPAVTRSIEQLVTRAHARGRHVGLCGQRPSNDPEFARFLVHAGIDSMSVTPDSFLAVKENVAAAEREEAPATPLPAPRPSPVGGRRTTHRGGAA